MRDQPSSRADDIGVSPFADFDLRHHIPDQLEIDLGDADAGILAGAGERQRHVGFRFPSEIYRPRNRPCGATASVNFRILG